VKKHAGRWERWIKPPYSRQPDTDLEEAPPSQTIETFTSITITPPTGNLFFRLWHP
jgi:murein tripeptide amidase MpaA